SEHNHVDEPAKSLFKPCTKFLDQVLHAQIASFGTPQLITRRQRICFKRWPRSLIVRFGSKANSRARRDICFVPKAVIADRPLNSLVPRTRGAAPGTAAEPPAIGWDGAVIHIEVSAWCRAERGRGPPYGYGKAIGVFSKVANANTGVVAGIPFSKIQQSEE